MENKPRWSNDLKYDYPLRTCQTCRYFQQNENDIHGTCRRYPPYTKVAADSWCGEWYPNDNEDQHDYDARFVIDLARDDKDQWVAVFHESRLTAYGVGSSQFEAITDIFDMLEEEYNELVGDDEDILSDHLSMKRVLMSEIFEE